MDGLLACVDKSSDDTGGMTTSAGSESASSGGEMETGAPTTTAAPTTGDGTSEGTSNGSTTTGGTSGGPVTTSVSSTGTTPDESSGGSTGTPAGCEGDAPRVRIATTMGDMVVELDAVNAPTTVANFIHYVESGFYVDTIFHRVIPDFVIQGGGLTADLMEKPTDPPIPLETSPNLLHVDGAISMARTMDPNSATSQFFICDGPQDFLDGQYAAFGVLVEGFDVLAAITMVQTGTVGQHEDVPVEDIVVLAMTCE